MKVFDTAGGEHDFDVAPSTAAIGLSDIIGRGILNVSTRDEKNAAYAALATLKAENADLRMEACANCDQTARNDALDAENADLRADAGKVAGLEAALLLVHGKLAGYAEDCGCIQSDGDSFPHDEDCAVAIRWDIEEALDPERFALAPQPTTDEDGDAL